MKIFHFILALGFFTVGNFFILESAAPAFEYRCAHLGDVENILKLYDGFTDDDNAKLLVFPREIRRKFLETSITKNHMYVACDPSLGSEESIVGFIKLFIVDDSDVLQIARDELRAVDSSMAVLPVINSYSIVRDDPFVLDFSKKPEYSPQHKEFSPDFLKTDVCVYYGGAYTHPACRNQGINTGLERFALRSILEEVSRKCFGAQGLMYMYGVVMANAESVARLRAWANYTTAVVLKLREDYGVEAAAENLAVYQFRAYKPSFTTVESSLALLPDDPANEGLGCFIRCEIK